MVSGLLAHGIWLDDLIVPLLVGVAYAIDVLRASVGEPGADGACPYCGAQAAERVVEQAGGPSDAPPTVRCGRCGFRLAARLSASEAAPVASGEEPR